MPLSRSVTTHELSDPALVALGQRIGSDHVHLRLAREMEYEQQVQRFGRRLFHFDTWYSVHALIRNSLRVVGIYRRAQRNARAVQLRQHEVNSPVLPQAFDGYRILQISDPHLDTADDIVRALIERVRTIEYDVCVLTGDFRTRTFGTCEPTLQALAQVRPHLKSPVFAVLGNHDSIRLVPRMEQLGIRVLLNEAAYLERAGATLYLAGVDDAHYYRLHDIQKVTPRAGESFSILLSHTPETFREAAAAGFQLMLSGHTHGGQICLPGGIPLITDTSDCPRRFTKGSWRYEKLLGYTSCGSGASIVDVRLNCPPEVTVHVLRRGAR